MFADHCGLSEEARWIVDIGEFIHFEACYMELNNCISFENNNFANSDVSIHMYARLYYPCTHAQIWFSIPCFNALCKV